MTVQKAWPRRFLAIAVSMAFMAGGLGAQSREDLLKTVEKSSAWVPVGEARLYDETNIKALEGKAAPSLIRYGLTGASLQEFKGPVRLELLEMADPSAAYGAFTLERDTVKDNGTGIALGTEAFRTSARTTFWQSRYVVKIDGDAKTAENLARLVSENIFGRSRKPPVSGHLPSNNMVPDSEKYVVEANGLDASLGLDPSRLGFEDDVEVATARYKVNGKNATLVLLLYPTQQLAKKYFEAMPQDSFGKRSVALISLVRGTHDESVAKEVLDSVGYETKTTWNERRPDITIKQVILTIFGFIGIALLFTIIAGMSFGGLRVFLKAKFPDRFFDRQSDTEIIQLKLIQEVTNKELER